MKKLGIFIGVLIVTIVSPFVVQFGWNEIVTTSSRSERFRFGKLWE